MQVVDKNKDERFYGFSQPLISSPKVLFDTDYLRLQQLEQHNDMSHNHEHCDSKILLSMLATMKTRYKG